MTGWAATIAEIDGVLDAWEAYVACPETEPMPVTAIPELPSAALDPNLIEPLRALKRRADLLQARLAELRREVAADLDELRKTRTAAVTYRKAEPEIMHRSRASSLSTVRPTAAPAIGARAEPANDAGRPPTRR